jgi:hypothetical protein
MNRVILAFIGMVISMTLIVSAIHAQGTFSDVSADHWAAEAISWGVKQKALDGYSDGSFAPGRAITEAEFLKILISVYETLPEIDGQWFDKYYAYANEKGWYVRGLKDQALANEPILRKGAAIILSSALGNSYLDDHTNSTQRAITDLYNKGLSNGKTEKTIEGFAPNEQLTRAEAVQFLYNFALKSGIEKLNASVSEVDWVVYENVDFSDDKGLLNKHELFAKKYDLQVITYQTAGWTYINLVSASEPSDETTIANFNLSSAYKIETDDTINWILVTNMDREDPKLAFELLTRIFSYDAEHYDSITQKLIPTVNEMGFKIDGQLRGLFGNLEVIARYNEDSNNYYINTKVAP